MDTLQSEQPRLYPWGMPNQVSSLQAALADTGDVALAHQQWAAQHGEYRPFDQLPRDAQTAILAIAQTFKSGRAT